MYESRQKKWIYIVLALILATQLCFGMSGIFDDKVFADKKSNGKLDIPSDIQASATADTITLKWSLVSEAESYDIELGGTVTEGISTDEHTFTGLNPDTEYAIRIRAVGKNSASEWSGIFTQKTASAKPAGSENPDDNPGGLGIPTNITYTIDSDKTVFNWDEVTGAESYDVELSSGLAENVTVTEYVYNNTQPGEEYTFRVRSVNSSTKSEWSEKIRVSASEGQGAVVPPEEEIPAGKQDPIIGNGNGLEGEYYDNRTLKDLVFVRKDREINFDWGTGTPDPSIRKNAYSIRWTGKLLAEYTATYTLYTYTGDGVRLWLDDKLVIDDWKSSAIRENTARVKLVAGQKYDIKIEYFNNNKESIAVLSWSCAYHDKKVIPQQQLFCKPDTPSNINTIAEGSKITVSWDNTPGAESYQIEADGNVIDNGMKTEYIHEGLTANTEHTYRIRAVNDVSAGDWTDLITKISAPATPENLSAAVDTTNILVSWDSVVAATAYDIEVNGSVIDNGNSTSYLHDGLNPNTKCTYRVRAKNENGISYWSEPLTRTTLPATPENVKVEPTSSSMKISWDAVDGAITYEIEADGQVVPSIKDTDYTFEGLAPDTAYTYKVRARNIEGGAGYWSEPITKKTLLETPAGITSDITDRSISLTWLPVNRAIGYEIEIDGSSIAYTTDTTFINEGLMPNSEHSYRVRAKNDDNLSEWSEKVTRLTLPDTPKNLVSNSTSYAITVSWEEIPGAISYDIEADGSIIDSTSGTTYVHNGLQPMTEYSYRVRAKSIAGAGYWSQPISETTKVGVPANINAVSTSKTITFTWDAVSEADRYEIELDGVVYNNGSETMYEYIELMPNSPHTYRVRAINEIGNGDWSELTTKYTAPDIPGNITATSTSTSITLTWDAVEAAAGYDVEVLGAPVDNGNSTTYTHNDLNPNTQRTYRVRAKNDNGIGDWSIIVAKSTLPGIPANLSMNPTETSIKLTWDIVAGATGYDVEADGVVYENVLTNEYNLMGLTPNNQHSFRVRAKNEDGSGDWSALVTGYTLPAAPIITVAEVTDTTIKIAWEKIDGVVGYDIEVDGLTIDIGAVNEYVHQNLLPNTEHTYRARAKVENGISSWSEPVTKLTLPDVPKNLKTTVTSSSVELTWDVVAGAIEYEIEADGIIATVTDSKYLHEMLTPNTEHIYKVRAKSEAGPGNWSEEARAFTLLGMPANIKTFSGSDNIQLVWDEVYGSTGYEIEADGSMFEIGAETKYIHSALMPNTTHIYRIRANKDGIAGDWSERTTAVTLLAAISDIKAVSTNTAITLTWTPIGDAESYDVEADGKVITGILEPAYKIEGLAPNTPHTFRVMAKSETNTSDWSELITKYTAPDIPVNIKTEATTSTIKITWDTVNGAVGYEIEVDGTAVDNGINLSYLHDKLTPNTQHIYKVRARNEYEAGAWSEAVIGTTEPELAFNCTEDSLFNFVIAAPKVEGATERTITVTYKADELEVIDFCTATAKKDIEVGEIQGTNLEVKEFTPGTIVFSLKDPNKAIMNAVKFKSKINGQAKIQYVIE